MLRKIIIPAPFMGVSALILFFVGALGILVGGEVREQSLGPQIGEGTCELTRWKPEKEFQWWGDRKRPTMILDCSGFPAETGDWEVVMRYLQNPGPLSCRWFEKGKAKCEVPSGT